MTRKALITGTSRGIGKDISEYLLQRRYLISGLSRSKNQIKNERYNHHYVDITNREQIDNFFSFYIKKTNILDLLILNSGGVNRYGNNDQLDIEDWIDTFKLNFFSNVEIVKKSLPLLKKSNSPSIIFIGSAVSTMPGIGNPHYSSSKSALLAYAKHLSLVYASSKIKVNTISPGPVYNEAFKENIDNFVNKENIETEKREFINNELKKIPLSRFTESSEIAELVYFLDSEKNLSITGQNIIIDGGKNRHF